MQGQETEEKNIKIEKVKIPFDFAQIFPGYFATPPLQRILEIIQRYSTEKNQAIILVKDLDYRDKYCKDEFKAFKKAKREEYHWKIIKNERLPKKAIRIDFFSVRINFNIDALKIDDLNNENYLGFCVLIPQYCNVNTFRAAQALLKIFPNMKNNLIYKEFHVKVTLKTQDNNLAIKIFTLKAFPFQEQNNYFLSCSHVALSACRWHIKTKPIKHEEFKDFAINCSKEILFPKIPSLYRRRSRGLNGYQITEIASTFSNPLYYSIEANPLAKNLIRLIYRYIRTGIPVLLGFDTEKAMHCVIIIGYTENNNLCWEILRKHYFNRYLTLPSYLSPQSNHEIDWVSHFIIQDNNFGPYLLFPYHKLEWLVKQENSWFLVLFPNGE